MSIVEAIKSKVKDYYGNLEMKEFPQGTRLVVLLGDKTYEIPSFKEAMYCDLNSKHEGSIVVARYNNKTKRTRVMVRISPDTAKRSFSECSSKQPTQVMKFDNIGKLFEYVLNNLKEGTPTFAKTSDDDIYVTGRITNYDGEMERKVALGLLNILAQVSNTKLDLGDEDTVQPTTPVVEEEDAFELPEMKLHYDFSGIQK